MVQYVQPPPDPSAVSAPAPVDDIVKSPEIALNAGSMVDPWLIGICPAMPGATRSNGKLPSLINRLCGAGDATPEPPEADESGVDSDSELTVVVPVKLAFGAVMPDGSVEPNRMLPVPVDCRTPLGTIPTAGWHGTQVQAGMLEL